MRNLAEGSFKIEQNFSRKYEFIEFTQVIRTRGGEAFVRDFVLVLSRMTVLVLDRARAPFH